MFDTEQCLYQMPQTQFAVVVALMKFLAFISYAHQFNCSGHFPECVTIYANDWQFIF